MNESSIILERPLTIEQAAQYLQIPRRTLRELCEKKKICHCRLDYRRWRFRKSDLDSFLETRNVQPVIMP
jgi:excisionase family DNA binding protein